MDMSNDTTFAGIGYPTKRDRDAAVLATWATANGLNSDEDAIRFLREETTDHIKAEIEENWTVENLDVDQVTINLAILDIVA